MTPLPSPRALVARAASDAAAVIRFTRAAPGQVERVIALGEEITELGASFLAVAEQIDGRIAEAIAIGERLDTRAAELIALGDRFDARGAEIVQRANAVAETGEELIAVLPAFERAVAMATPLEGAIDRVGRLVDMLPGGAAARRRAEAVDAAGAALQSEESSVERS